jgi:hypothetical protein
MTLRAKEKRTATIRLFLSLLLGLSPSPLRAQTITPPFADSFTEMKGWTSVDIGDADVLGGSDTSVQGGELVISGSGSLIGGDADGCRFVYQKISGDFVAVTRLTVSPTFQAGSAAGLMVRQTDDSGSDMAFVGSTRDNGTVFVARSGGTATVDTGSMATVDSPWLRLERRGQWVTGSFSFDGKTWFNNVGAAGSPSAVQIPLSDPVLLGLAVTPANNTAIDIAHFSDFTVDLPAAGTGGFAATVTVKDAPEPEEGEPPVTAVGLYVRATDASGKDLGGAYVTGDRAVVLSGIPPGPVKLQAVGNGYDSYEADLTIEAGKVAETSFEITPSDAILPTGTITGKVSDASAKGQSSVKIRAISTGASAQGPVYLNATTNAQGMYTLTAPPGTYSVMRLSDPRFVPVNDDVQTGVAVTAGGTASANFTVQTLPIVDMSTDNGFDWKIEVGADVTADEDHTALDDPETNFIDYPVIDGKSPWGVLDATPRVYGWVRLKFQLPDSIKAFQGNDLRLYGFTFEDTDTCYWNGVKIGGAGKHNEQDVNDDTGFVSAWNLTRDYRVPGSAVNWTGDNVIAFKGFVRNSTVENGGFSVKSPPLLTVIQTAPTGKKGDLNGDGLINISDATLALRVAVGLLTPSATQKALGDVNGDGKINIQDATKILQAAIGLIQL